MILVDTNVWSELVKSQANSRVLDWLTEHDPQLWLSVVVIGEIRMGAELPKARHRRDDLLAWLGGLETAYAERVLPFDADAAHMFGALRARRQAEATLLDMQLAAQAMAHDMVVATRNARDFEWTGVKVVNPWKG